MRLPRLIEFLNRNKPDVVCLQETKVSDDNFPIMELGAVGYNAILHGQKARNGVAILIRGQTKQHGLVKFTDIAPPDIMGGKSGGLTYTDKLCGFPKDPAPNEARVISACVGG